MIVIKAPEPRTRAKSLFKIFLAGSIDQGRAIDWQDEVSVALSDLDDVALFNPRRDDWDSSWVQSIEDPKFSQQVRWELAAMEEADLVVFYFDPKGQAPITLLELGLNARRSNVIVCCPDGYWRKGNVEVVCDTYDLPLFDNIDDFIIAIRDTVLDS